jgi:hypothetical protein
MSDPILLLFDQEDYPCDHLLTRPSVRLDGIGVVVTFILGFIVALPEGCAGVGDGSLPLPSDVGYPLPIAISLCRLIASMFISFKVVDLD